MMLIVSSHKMKGKKRKRKEKYEVEQKGKEVRGTQGIGGIRWELAWI